MGNVLHFLATSWFCSLRSRFVSTSCVQFRYGQRNFNCSNETSHKSMSIITATSDAVPKHTSLIACTLNLFSSDMFDSFVPLYCGFILVFCSWRYQCFTISRRFQPVLSVILIEVSKRPGCYLRDKLQRSDWCNFGIARNRLCHSDLHNHRVLDRVSEYHGNQVNQCFLTCCTGHWHDSHSNVLFLFFTCVKY